MNPAFTIRNVMVVLHPLDVVSMPLELLGKRVGSLSDSGDAIIAALDEVMSRATRRSP